MKKNRGVLFAPLLCALLLGAILLGTGTAGTPCEPQGLARVSSGQGGLPDGDLGALTETDGEDPASEQDEDGALDGGVPEEAFEQYAQDQVTEDAGASGRAQADGTPYEIAADEQYEEDVVLVELAEGGSVADVEAVLGERLGGDAAAEEVADGVVRIELPTGTSVEDAVTQLRGEGAVADAQPSFCYTVMDEDDATTSQVQPSAGEPAAGEVGPDLSSDGADATSVEDVSEAAATDVEVEEGESSGTSSDEPPLPEVPSPEVSGDRAGEGDAADGGTELEVQDEGLVLEGEDEPALEAASTSVNDAHARDQWELDSMNVKAAWDIAKTNGAVTVATFDCGCDVSHPDLAANVVGAYNAHNAMMGYDTSDVSPISGSYYQHGTHVSGIVAAVANNGLGVAGVSYNACVMPVKVVDDDGAAYTADLLKAYDYVIENASRYNIRVVNISLGRRGQETSDAAVVKKIDEAYAKGIVTVASAGNASSVSGDIPPYDCFPSDCENVVSVMNLKQSGSGVVLSGTSNYNAANEKDKNISAPGTSIYSTVPNGDYGYKSGTSMAAPQVSGVLALMFAANNKLSAGQAVSILYQSAKDLGQKGWDRTYGYGEVDAYEALRRAKTGGASGSASATATAGTSVPASSASPQKQVKDDTAKASGTLRYRGYVAGAGWEKTWRGAGVTAGVVGKRLEALQLKLVNAPYAGKIEYRAYVQKSGWEKSRTSSGKTSGLAGKGRRIEAVQIRLTGEMAKHYDVWYRTYVRSKGWLGWARNDSPAGSYGLSKRIEAIQVKLLVKGSALPGRVYGAYASKKGRTPAQSSVGHDIVYRTYAQTYGWQGKVYDGQMSGTQGLGKRLEAIRVSLSNKSYRGSIEYRTYVQGYGWRKYVRDGAKSGVTGKKKRLEAIQIRLTQEMAKHYDVWYRVRAQTFGWMGWAKNNARAGSAGYGKRLEAIQILLMPKGSSAPGSTAKAFRKK